MDEPFSSLDPRLRDQVREQTVDLLRRTGTTTILVTHDPVEAMRVADRIGVLAQGRLVQFGTAADIYQRPCSPQMACVFGHVNTVEGAVEGGSLVTPLGAFSAPPSASPGPAIVCVRPQHVRLETGGPGVRAIVTGVTCVGDVTEVQLRVRQPPAGCQGGGSGRVRDRRRSARMRGSVSAFCVSATARARRSPSRDEGETEHDGVR